MMPSTSLSLSCFSCLYLDSKTENAVKFQRHTAFRAFFLYLFICFYRRRWFLIFISLILWNWSHCLQQRHHKYDVWWCMCITLLIASWWLLVCQCQWASVIKLGDFNAWIWKIKYSENKYHVPWKNPLTHLIASLCIWRMAHRCANNKYLFGNNEQLKIHQIAPI